MHCSSVSSSEMSTTCPTPECRATMMAKAAAMAVTSSVSAIGGSRPAVGLTVDGAKPDIASASVANPGRVA